MEERSKNAYHTHLYQFCDQILVVCPSCADRALVQSGGFLTPKQQHYDIKVTCGNCGFNKMLYQVSAREDKKQKKGNILIFGAPIDPFFHLPLWLQTDFQGHTLWVYNEAHLHFLRAHLAAKLRERNQGTRNNRSIGARLPRWMTAATNREAVLKALDQLPL